MPLWHVNSRVWHVTAPLRHANSPDLALGGGQNIETDFAPDHSPSHAQIFSPF